jgi:hypothetical protein
MWTPALRPSHSKIMGIHVKVTELFSKDILQPMFVYGDCMAVCLIFFIHLSATGVAEIVESTNLKGCPHAFVCIYSVCTLKVMQFIINAVPYIIFYFCLLSCIVESAE